MTAQAAAAAETHAVFEARRELRATLAASGAMLGAGHVRGSVGPPIQSPFGNAEAVEGSDIVSHRVPLDPDGPVPDAAFADGHQRFAVEGWVGIAPVVRAHVSAAVMARRDGKLVPAEFASDEFVVAPMAGLPDDVAAALEGNTLGVVDSGGGDRRHPYLDLERAAAIVDERRRDVERTVIRRARAAAPDRWVVVDGTVGALDDLATADRVIGVIKSHETQFLAGADLEVALTLDAGHRTSVFARVGAGGKSLHTWYVRLWDGTGEDLLFGLIRLERAPGVHVVEQVDTISAWMLRERAPIAGRDPRWDRLIYPIHTVGEFLRARAGAWR